jgi:hypothetical protein
MAATPVLYEAEAAMLSGVTVSRSHAGYTGNGFVDYRTASGEFIEWTVTADAGGTHVLEFRYANGSSSTRPLELKVNGVVAVARLAFDPTGAWSTWRTVSQPVTLAAGPNRVRLSSVGSSGPNVDSVTVRPQDVGVPPGTQVLQAESATLSGPRVGRGNPGYTGTGYVDFENATGDYVEWSVEAKAAGPYELAFRYANGGGRNRPLQLTVNAQVVQSPLPFTPTGSWSTWAESKVAVTLAAGVNLVRVTATGSSGPNMDALRVSPAQAQEDLSLRVYHIGNSVTNTLTYTALRDMADSDGREYLWGRHVISGAPLSWIWDHPDQGFKTDPYGRYPQALPQYEWDVLTLQPFERQIESDNGQGDLTNAKKFIDLALTRSPNLQVYIYQRWPRRQGDAEEGYSLDYEAQWLKTYNEGEWDGTTETRDYFARLIQALREEYPDSPKPALMIPVGDVMFELDRRIEAGDVPGINSIQDLYFDSIHLNNIGAFLVGTTFYATMYQRDPRGIDFSSYNDLDDPWDRTITAAQAAAIQDAVWDVVRGHPFSGVS